MFPHGLKINISVNIAILLGIAMILTDFVMLISAQKILIESEISRAYLFISAIENLLIGSEGSLEKEMQDSVCGTRLNNFLQDSGYICAMTADIRGNPICTAGIRSAFQTEIQSVVREAVLSGNKITRSFGTARGILWKQRQYLTVSSPLFHEGKTMGGVCLMLALERVYVPLRLSQQMLSVYILINIIVLTLIGLLRLSKVTVKPVQNLLKRAEEWSDTADFFFLNETENNEFSQLSKSLNRMFKRISEDKIVLEATVSSLEKANRELKQAHNDVIRAEKLASVGRLSSGIAHEIGNPLAIVIAYLELLGRDDVTEDEKKEFIARAEKEISRINVIIRQLLDFSRPSAERPEIVSVHDLIKDMADVFRCQPLMADVRVELSLSAENDRVLADPDRLRQVFLNLAINAADAIAAGENRADGRLLISTEIADSPENSRCASMLKLVFSDNGCGISQENLVNIFDPFYTTKDPGKGTGLGLSVSFMIIASAGGNIKAVSEPGKGTAMELYLPVYREKPKYDEQQCEK